VTEIDVSVPYSQITPPSKTEDGVLRLILDKVIVDVDAKLA
jgi:hypothetical protein